MTMSSQLASVDEVESALLCELVDGLTATRNEQAVRTADDTQRWANANTREFVLACVAVYARGRRS
jgi:hypothetical protein